MAAPICQTSRPTQLDADYLVYGAGAMGMAFVDVLMAESNATVVLVDGKGQPGGHWNDAYGFVRLHQPAAYYGVNSRRLERTPRDYLALSSKHEILAYFESLVEGFVKGGRCKFFPMCTTDDPSRSRFFRSSVDESLTYEVSARAKVVDATYLTAVVPSKSHANTRYSIASGVDLISLNGLPEIRKPYETYVVVGAGKTGVDAVLWLRGNGVAADRISWIMPRDSWFVVREACTPNGEARRLGGVLEALQKSTSWAEINHNFEKADFFQRLDPAIEPTMGHCATVSSDEMQQLRAVPVVRKGRVRSVEPGRLVLQGGAISMPASTLYVDCSVNGLTIRPPVPVFRADGITLQSLRICQQVFSAALIAHIELQGGLIEDKNKLCRVIPMPDTPAQVIHGYMLTQYNNLAWIQAGLGRWLASSRLNSDAHVADWGATFSFVADLVKRGKGGMLFQNLQRQILTEIGEGLRKIETPRSKL